MSNTRRGFLALVGGSPALFLPSLVAGSEQTAPLLTESELEGLANMRSMMPSEVWRDWLESGMRQARLWNGRDSVTVDRVMGGAVERHGSLMAAKPAGAL